MYSVNSQVETVLIRPPPPYISIVKAPLYWSASRSQLRSANEICNNNTLRVTCLCYSWHSCNFSDDSLVRLRPIILCYLYDLHRLATLMWTSHATLSIPILYIKGLQADSVNLIAWFNRISSINIVHIKLALLPLHKPHAV